MLDLNSLSIDFTNSNSLTIKIGCELEFFLLKKNKKEAASLVEVNNFIKIIPRFLTTSKISYKITKEQGASQIELQTDFSSDLNLLAQFIEEFKIDVSLLANNNNLQTSFAPQIFVDDCGNSLQFNISLHDNHGNNCFAENSILHKFCQNLLNKTPQILPHLINNDEDYQRFNKELNLNLFKIGKYTAPVNLSYGFDNRSCAIRIAKTHENKKRVEYRIAGANSNCYNAIAAILNNSKNFSQNELITNDKRLIFGNAFDNQYNYLIPITI